MLTQTDLERERYEARRKAQLDHNSNMNAARREGRYEEKIALVQSYERRLSRAETPTEQLASRSQKELTQLASNLLTELLNRQSSNG